MRVVLHRGLRSRRQVLSPGDNGSGDPQGESADR